MVPPATNLLAAHSVHQPTKMSYYSRGRSRRPQSRRRSRHARIEAVPDLHIANRTARGVIDLELDAGGSGIVFLVDRNEIVVDQPPGRGRYRNRAVLASIELGPDNASGAAITARTSRSPAMLRTKLIMKLPSGATVISGSLTGLPPE